MTAAERQDGQARSYYGQPILKAPVWRDDIPAYFFTGGLAAGSALLAIGADLTQRPALRRSARLTSLGSLAASTYFLVHDLGRPERFYHMLRVAKPTSPMSMGSWILAAFGPAAGVAAASELMPPLRPFGRAAGCVAAGLAPAVATYTAVLLADTAVPAWHEASPELPFLFAGGALASASGAGLITAPLDETGPARRLAILGSAVELAATRRVETRMGLLSQPFQEGASGRLLRAARGLTLAGAAGALLGRRSRVVSALSGAALLAASAATRFGVYAGGVASAKDPQYTVAPQRDRLRAGSHPSGTAGARAPHRS
jgi:hypothetical protein